MLPLNICSFWFQCEVLTENFAAKKVSADKQVWETLFYVNYFIQQSLKRVT